MNDSTNDSHPVRWVLGVTGASGALYAQRLLRLMLAAGVETHLVVSALGVRLLHDELGIEGLNVDALTGLTAEQREAQGVKLVMHNFRDVGASIASGSFQHDGMVICPCSSNTMAAIANGMAQHLIQRAAYVTLKERRPLIIVHREMPLTRIDVDNMKRLSDAGAILAPANPGFYMLPESVDDLVDYVAGRCLDLMNIKHSLDIRWAK